MENNTEKVVVIFDRIDETAITVIESLGGEIQPKESVKNYRMKHGQDRFCGVTSAYDFAFGLLWNNRTNSDLLKVVRV